MSYRSDIRVLVKPKDYQYMWEYCQHKAEEGDYKSFVNEKYFDVFSKTKDYVYFGWVAVKWYEGNPDFPDVRDVMECLSYFEENDIEYRYTRIGESLGDIEERYCCGEHSTLDFIGVNVSFYDDDFVINEPEKQAEFLRKEYPVGSKVRLICMNDPIHPVPPNTQGEVTSVDDIGTIHVAWENGSSLGLVYGEDRFEKISEC